MTKKTAVSQGRSDSSKLASLLALAAGAAAVPQTGNATIIVDTQGGSVFPGSSYQCSFPGAARLLFHGNSSRTTIASGIVRKISFSQTAGYVRIKATWLGAGLRWGQVPASSVAGIAPCAEAKSTPFSGGGFSPASFSNKYLSFEFADTTAGNAMRYGWIEVSLQNGAASSGYPVLTITEWAYDNSGVEIATGQTTSVPEPCSASLLAIGALALGAKGIRNWRRNGPQQEDLKAD